MDDKKIEIVNGDGEDLDISPVSEYIDIQKPEKKPNNDEIVIPGEKK